MFDHTSAIAKAGLSDGRMLIGGELVGASDGGDFGAIDPTTGDELTRVPLARKEDVDRAVTAARAALDGPWGSWGPSKRARALNELADLCDARKKDLARLESLDVGMPRGFAKRFSVAALIKNLRYYASWADKLYGETIPQSSPAQLDYTRREPYGVVAAITAWNTPLLFVGSKLGPALATGNAVILKPSELGCLTTLEVAKLVGDAGFPPGVVQVLTGDGETGRLLVEHPGIDLISFTGSRATAREVQRAAAAGPTPLICELGGKSANLIFEDADLGRATMLSTFGVFGLAGQTCAAGSRLLVQRSVHDEMVERIASFAAGLSIGDPLDPSTMTGPLNGRAQHDRVRSMVAAAEAEGATVRPLGRIPDAAADAGTFLQPHLILDVDPALEIWREEVFGPVLCVMPFDTEEDALRLANASEYGLAAAVWTKDLARAHRVAARLQAGVVWVNTYGVLPNSVPFGGFKGSGWGKEGGRDALLGYSRVKNILVDLN